MQTCITVDKFKIYADFDDIIKDATDYESDYDEDRYVKYGDSLEQGDSALTKEEYEANAKNFIEEIKALNNEQKLRNIIERWPRKKNGTFNRKNVEYLVTSGNTYYICEWHNTWIYATVKAVAVDDTTLRIEFFQKTDTPG